MGPISEEAARGLSWASVTWTERNGPPLDVSGDWITPHLFIYVSHEVKGHLEGVVEQTQVLGTKPITMVIKHLLNSVTLQVPSPETKLDFFEEISTIFLAAQV